MCCWLVWVGGRLPVGGWWCWLSGWSCPGFWGCGGFGGLGGVECPGSTSTSEVETTSNLSCSRWRVSTAVPGERGGVAEGGSVSVVNLAGGVVSTEKSSSLCRGDSRGRRHGPCRDMVHRRTGALYPNREPVGDVLDAVARLFARAIATGRVIGPRLPAPGATDGVIEVPSWSRGRGAGGRRCVSPGAECSDRPRG